MSDFSSIFNSQRALCGKKTIIQHSNAKSSTAKAVRSRKLYFSASLDLMNISSPGDVHSLIDAAVKNLPLSSREREIVRRLVWIGNSAEIAAGLELRPATLRAHVRNIFMKLNLSSRGELVSLVVRNSLKDVAVAIPQERLSHSRGKASHAV